MRRLREIAPYIGWSFAAATLIFCLGSLQAFATGLDKVARSLQLDDTPEASLVYDRDNRVVFSFASEDRTNIPLDQVSGSMVAAVVAAEDRFFYRHAGM